MPTLNSLRLALTCMCLIPLIANSQTTVSLRYEGAILTNSTFRSLTLDQLLAYNDVASGYAYARTDTMDTELLQTTYSFDGPAPFGLIYGLEQITGLPRGTSINLGVPFFFDFEGEVETEPLTTFTQVDMSEALADGGQFAHIAFGAGRFVTYMNPPFGESRDYVEIWTSEDGENWTTYNIPGYQLPGDLNFLGDRFMLTVAQPNFIGAILYSLDGINWEETVYPEFYFAGLTAYGDGTWVAVGGPNRLYSTDGVNWERGTSANGINSNAVTFTDGIFVELGGVGSFETSSDGITWVETDPDTMAGYITDGAFAAAANGQFFNYFPREVRLTGSSLAVDTAANDQLMAFASGLTLIGPSPDSMEVIPMNPQPNAFTNQLYGAFGNGVYVSTGASGIYVAPEFEIPNGGGNGNVSVSPWAALPLTEGYRLTSDNGQPGIGWVDDSVWPWIFSFSLNAWMYIYPEADLNGMFAYNYSTGNFIWFNPAWGWYFDFTLLEWFSF